MLVPVPMNGFGGGLNLRDKVDAISEREAIDCMNVVFTEREAVYQRPGFDNFSSSALTNRPESLAPHLESDGTRQLLAGCGTRLEALNTSGGIVASATALTTGTWSFTRFGGPTAEISYAGNGANDARKWDGATWSAVAAIGKPRYLAVLAVEAGNRMVIGGFDSGANGPAAATVNPARVHFSGAGAPETYGANDYVDFYPGDGEKVQGIIAWREFILIFKETKFFVVYGSSEGPDGNPIFHWRAVNTGVGLASPRALSADETGVYFMDRSGVFKTTGGEPEHLSSLIEPIFYGGESPFYTGGILAHGSITNCAMHVFEDRVYLAYPTSSANNRILVYDSEFGWWSLWDIPASCLSSFRRTDRPELVFGYATGSNHVGYQLSTHTSDDGTAITSKWRSGWFDFELTPVKVIRQSLVWGSGTVFCGIAADFAQSPGTLIELTMGGEEGATWNGGTTWNGGGLWETGAARGHAFRDRSEQGTVFSTYFFNNTLNEQWTVARLEHQLRETRVPAALAT